MKFFMFLLIPVFIFISGCSSSTPPISQPTLKYPVVTEKNTKSKPFYSADHQTEWQQKWQNKPVKK